MLSAIPDPTTDNRRLASLPQQKAICGDTGLASLLLSLICVIGLIGGCVDWFERSQAYHRDTFTNEYADPATANAVQRIDARLNKAIEHAPTSTSTWLTCILLCVMIYKLDALTTALRRRAE